MAGRVLAVEPLGSGRFAVEIALPSEAAGSDLGQLLTLLFGNASLFRGVRIERVVWPSDFLARFVGPRHGIAGLRALTGGFDRPLSCGAAKPLGLGATALAKRCGALARGGLDLVKDDHGLADPLNAPWRERITRCQEEVARALGIRALLVAPLPLGLGTVAELGELASGAGGDLAILAHPALSGAFFAPDHGISPAVLLGDLFRLAGCDAVVYPHEGGRFPLAARETAALRDHLRRPLGSIAPAFPVLAGGVDPARVSALAIELGTEIGNDTIFLFGTGLYVQAHEADLERAAALAAQAVRALGGVPTCSPRS